MRTRSDARYRRAVEVSRPVRHGRDARHTPQHIHRHRRHTIGHRGHNGERDAARRTIVVLVLPMAGTLLRHIAGSTQLIRVGNRDGCLRGRGLASMYMMMIDVAARRGMRRVVIAILRMMMVAGMLMLGVMGRVMCVPRPVQSRPRPSAADTGQHESQQQKPGQRTATRRSRELPKHAANL